MKHQLRNHTGRFTRNPVTADQFFSRARQIAQRQRIPLSRAEQQAADELRLRLICDGVTGEVADFVELRKGQEAFVS